MFLIYLLHKILVTEIPADQHVQKMPSFLQKGHINNCRKFDIMTYISEAKMYPVFPNSNQLFECGLLCTCKQLVICKKDKGETFYNIA